jgi:hypothetical protein
MRDQIAAYAFNGALYCPEHRPAEGCADDSCRDSQCCPQPIFSWDEGWEHHTCDTPHNEPGEPLHYETLRDYHYGLADCREHHAERSEGDRPTGHGFGSPI